MPYRRPTRFLAPLALAGALAAIYFVAKPYVDDGSPAAAGQSHTTSTTTNGTKRTAKIYTVKPGDTLGGISARTGVPIQDLIDDNDIDDENLDVGQKLKLAP